MKTSPKLSLLAHPGDGRIRTRLIAILVAQGVQGASLELLREKLSAEGAVPRFLGARLGTVATSDGRNIDVEITLETAPSVLFDAVVIPDGEAGVTTLAKSGPVLEFVKDQYRHCKTILALGKGESVLDAASIPRAPKERADPGLLVYVSADKAATPFIAAVGKHRHFERQSDPPVV